MENKNKTIDGIILDPIKRRQYRGRLIIRKGFIDNIIEVNKTADHIILPGFIDSHVHIESSMLTPQNFADLALKHGTVAAVADPHEIANVSGLRGVNFFINNAKKARIKIYFGAPSCVPASPIDDCFKPLGVKEIYRLLRRKDIYFLSEMMNYPGVINRTPDVIEKINASLKLGKPVDGHAPGLKSKNLKEYVSAGISTDHECSTMEEALEKINLGMKILIREGSAAKNFNALDPLIKNHAEKCMFCTDDCHPDDLIKGHINELVRRSIDLGYNIFDILQIASVNPVKHYNLNVGLLQIGDPADFIVVENLKTLKVKSVVIRGEDVLIKKKNFPKEMNKVKTDYHFPKKFNPINLDVLKTGKTINVIEILPGELITRKVTHKIQSNSKYLNSDIEKDILKLVIINRYNQEQVFTAFIKGFGLKNGAIASSIAHDSHHILATGADDKSIEHAIRFVLRNKGGISFSTQQKANGLKLPVYGLISDKKAASVAKKYSRLVEIAKENGVKLESPFMTLSFMALTVIPELKISPKGLFDVNKFQHTPLFDS